MTPEQVDVMINQKLSGMERKINEIHSALKGNAISNDKGIVGRLEQLELDNAHLEGKIEVLEKAKSSIKVQLSSTYNILGILIAIIFFIFEAVRTYAAYTDLKD
jgi:hypothetical protein